MNQTSDFRWHFINFHYRIRGGSKAMFHCRRLPHEIPPALPLTDSTSFLSLLSGWKNQESNNRQNLLTSRKSGTGARNCKQVRPRNNIDCASERRKINLFVCFNLGSFEMRYFVFADNNSWHSLFAGDYAERYGEKYQILTFSDSSRKILLGLELAYGKRNFWDEFETVRICLFLLIVKKVFELCSKLNLG